MKRHLWLPAILVLVSSAIALAAEDPLPPNLDTSLAKGLAFLAKQQNADGSFDPTANSPRTAITGLSLLSFLASGHTPDAGRYGLVVRGAIDYLLSQSSPEGYLGGGPNERGMYSHAIATLALAESYGVESNPERRLRARAILEKAIKVIVAAQDAPKSAPVYAGGWRYDRAAADSDLSLSGWNALALRAGQDAGVEVPRESGQRAVEFVLRCFDPNAKAFAYQPATAAQSGDTAIAVLCLYVLDASDRSTPQIESGIKYLMDHAADPPGQFPYYADYYSVQAAFQKGGDVWTKFGRTTLERIIKTQDADGGWPQSKAAQEPGRTYATAMSLQAMAVPYRLLPVYQR